MLRYVLLALIAETGPLHGYALMKAFAARSGVRLSIGNVYRELQRLRSEGHIQAAENPVDADPRRAPYAITSAGREALSSWFVAPADAFLREVVDPLCCRLALLGDCDRDVALTFLADLQTELSQQRRTVERKQSTASGAGPILRILLGRRTRHLAADIEIVAEIRDALTATSSRQATRQTARPADRKGGNPRRRVSAERVGH
jgi:DNA-binding PadR family transcriptional regulator